MKRIFLFYLIFSLSCLIGHSQNNSLVLNGAYIILNGGTPTTNIYLVIDQSNTLGIIRPSGGHISSEAQYNFVKWNVGTNTGNYVFAFGVNGNPADYIPFIFNKTTGGSSDISMSTWTSNSSNVPWPGVTNVAAVTNMNITGTSDLSIPSVIDRWWDIQSPSPVSADLTFSYRGTENTTAIPTDTFKAQHWNGSTWDVQVGPGNPGITSGIGTVGPIPGQTTFSPWILTRTGLAATILSFQYTACNLCTGTATAAPIGGTSPYSYSWNNGQTTQTCTGLCAGTYSVFITDATNNNAVDTVTILQPIGPIATASASNTTISAGGNSQLNATGGGTYSWSPSNGLNCITCANPIASPTQTTSYCVFITDVNGCTASACIDITVEFPCIIQSLETLLPNAFSPNNDSHNDQFCVPNNACIKTFILIIYDRWGEKVFETDDLKKCWDGIYNGKNLNTDVFAYYFIALLNSGEKFTQKGNISLIR